MEYTKRRNLNRGYMTLEVWQRGMDLFNLESKRGKHDWRDRAQDKILAREPGGAFGVRAYSAAVGLARGLVARSMTSSREKRRNTRALQTLRDFRCNLAKNLSPSTRDNLPLSNNPTIQQSNNPISR